MNEKEKLEAELIATRKKLAAITDAEELGKAKSLVGKCFKYRNCYSCPQKPSDYWWLYIKFVGVKGYSPIAFRFQTDRDGMIEIKESELLHLGNHGRYTKIKAKEFNAAWNRLQKRIAGMKP